jgi:hypothetical protein
MGGIIQTALVGHHWETNSDEITSFVQTFSWRPSPRMPAMKLPSSGTLLCRPLLPATPSPKANAFMRSAQNQGNQAC